MLTRGSWEPELLTWMYMNISGTATSKIFSKTGHKLGRNGVQGTSTNDPFLVLFDGTRWPPESILASD
jgi:hypothetical protein